MTERATLVDKGKVMPHQIKRTDHMTSVNCETHCIARFSKEGYEIMGADRASIGQPPIARVKRPPIATWVYLWTSFKGAVLKHHQIKLGPDDAPRFMSAYFEGTVIG